MAFEFKDGMIVTESKSQLVKYLQNEHRTVTFPNKINISITCGGDSFLSIKCKCGKKHKWIYVSKVPKKSFKCSCGQILIYYKKASSPKFRFIAKS